MSPTQDKAVNPANAMVFPKKRANPLSLSGRRQITQTADAQPKLDQGLILRMDSEVMVMEVNVQGGLSASFILVFLLLVAIFSAPFILPEWIKLILNSTSIFDQAALGVALAAPGFIFFLFYKTTISPAPSPIIFNRKQGMIYGSHNGRPQWLEWKKVRPYLSEAAVTGGAYGGTHHNAQLVLVEWDEQLAEQEIFKKANGLLVSSSIVYGWKTCYELWEFIRCYMEGQAEALPEVEVSPTDESRLTTLMLDDGPFWEFTERQGLIQQLRDRQGKPRFGLGLSCLLVFMAPGVIFNLLRSLLRPRVKLPAEWLPPADPTQPSLFKVRQPDAQDKVLRAKAARYIACWQLGCVGLGIAIWIKVIHLIAF
ncbi:hypothetical protein HNQ59_000522 [Chitinivorax tropicus]|uniref:DUF6708 domain-containing protein n=1 Tax=Chitinivorax tropicus TaxID=714531 RepID=A0A840MF01_9PROT|nr:DUF6708 domain-containing protein [Chitinivorax tropicus]MBB5017258.1 hypothetical protein [Chitinivorax tropicus]